MIKKIWPAVIEGCTKLHVCVSFTFRLSLFILPTIMACEPGSKNRDEFSSIQNENDVNENITTAVDSGSTTDSAKAITPNFSLLAGDWVRSDGGYMLILRDISPQGTLKTEYFNPKEIHVGKSAWRLENNNIILKVELQDINYPGSVYSLQYFPNEDKLAGNYFQAVEGANYDVVFARK